MTTHGNLEKSQVTMKQNLEYIDKVDKVATILYEKWFHSLFSKSKSGMLYINNKFVAVFKIF